MNDSEKKVLSYLKENNKYTQKDLVNLTELSRAYLNKIINSLKNKCYIERVGSDKKGYWKILK